MSNRGYDPLTAIPSAESIRRRLGEVLELLRRLRVLLRVAVELEDSNDGDRGEAGRD